MHNSKLLSAILYLHHLHGLIYQLTLLNAKRGNGLFTLCNSGYLKLSLCAQYLVQLYYNQGCHNKHQ